jgi:hypothetical protein
LQAIVTGAPGGEGNPIIENRNLAAILLQNVVEASKEWCQITKNDYASYSPGIGSSKSLSCLDGSASNLPRANRRLE